MSAREPTTNRPSASVSAPHLSGEPAPVEGGSGTSAGFATAVVATSGGGVEGEGGSAAAATDFASTLSGGPKDSLSVLICLNLALVYIRKGDINSCEVCFVRLLCEKRSSIFLQK